MTEAELRTEDIDLYAPRGRWGQYPPLIDFVDKMGDCWEWTGYIEPKGYGLLSYKSKPIRAHVLFWRALVGSIPDGLQIDHLCRNKACVNPDHLEPVTHAENVRRGEAGRRNRIKTHCPQGHPYSGENLITSPTTNHRMCRTCQRGHKRRSRMRNLS